MKRIFSDYAYSPGPRAGCWWDKTCDIPEFPKLRNEIRSDVVIVGAGFTGLNAALTLAQGGADVVVLDGSQPGWGASGRNGGFCCLGGGMASDKWLDDRYGRDERLLWRRTEMNAIAHVDTLIGRMDIDVDRHSEGETMLAHRARNFRDFEDVSQVFEENYGVAARITPAHALRQESMQGGFHGALTIPLGFALNPRKYLGGLVRACVDCGVRIFGNTNALSVGRNAELTLSSGRVSTDRVIIATNGYSSEDVPEALRGRYLPFQSSVMVTRPFTEYELQQQGWTSTQMAYDTRNLLHYFRLMPDNRFLFGMRGGVLSSAGSDANIYKTMRRHFGRMFPAWRNVEVEGYWSGMISVARNKMPFLGELPGQPGILSALCFHGNGVAMGSYAGHMLGQLALGQTADIPAAMCDPLARFPLGRLRRALVPPLYAALHVADLSP